MAPCWGLEDFPENWKEEQAAEVLAGWLALWRPELIVATQKVPSWSFAAQPPDALDTLLAYLPSRSVPHLPEGWLERATEEGAILLEATTSQRAIEDGLFEATECQRWPSLSPEIVARFEFLALQHLIVELITFRMSYISGIDQDTFATVLVQAAEAAEKNDREGCFDALSRCEDLLMEAREYSFHVEPNLIEVVPLWAEDVDDTFLEWLAELLPTTLVSNRCELEKLLATKPEVFSQLKEYVQSGKLMLALGEPGDVALLDHNAILRNLELGNAFFEEHLGARPTTFAQLGIRSLDAGANFSPILPDILEKAGFLNGLHCSFGDDRMPIAEQSRTDWEGLGGTILPVISKKPLEMTTAASLLTLPTRLSQMADYGAASTLLLARRAGSNSSLLDGMRRLLNDKATPTKATEEQGEEPSEGQDEAYSSEVYGNDDRCTIGTFYQLEKYFEETDYSGHQQSLPPDKYPAGALPRLLREGETNPISRFADYYRNAAALEAVQTVGCLASVLTGKPDFFPPSLPDAWTASVTMQATASEAVQELLEATPETLSTILSASQQDNAEENSDKPSDYLFNPLPYSRKLVAGIGRPVPVLGCSFTKLDKSGSTFVPKKAKKKAKKKSIVERGLQRLFTVKKNAYGPQINNEFFCLEFDPVSGAMIALTDYHTRGPRLAHKLGMRLGGGEGDDAKYDGGHDLHYALLAADSFAIKNLDKIRKQAQTQGRLVTRKGKLLADYEQKITVTQGQRTYQIELNLQPSDYLQKILANINAENCWEHYVCLRWAWHDETSSTSRNVSWTEQPTERNHLEAPLFYHLRTPKARTTLLFGGLPFHRRFGIHKLDTLLQTKNETATSFRLGVCVDSKDPLRAAMGLLSPRLQASSAFSQDAFLFGCPERGVLASDLTPVVTEGAVTGMRMQLIETGGKKRKTHLVLPKDVASAELDGNELDLTERKESKKNRVPLRLRRNQFATLEVAFDENKSG